LAVETVISLLKPKRKHQTVTAKKVTDIDVFGYRYWHSVPPLCFNTSIAICDWPRWMLQKNNKSNL